MKGSLAGACDGLVWTVSLGVSTEIDLFGESALGLRTERTCLEFLVASKGSSEDLDKNL